MNCRGPEKAKEGNLQVQVKKGPKTQTLNNVNKSSGITTKANLTSFTVKSLEEM